MKFFTIAAFSLGCLQIATAVGADTPRTGWIVGPIVSKEDNKVRFCSMKRVDQNGQVLVFARNTLDANFIAIDFQKDTIEVGRQYTMTIHSASADVQATAVAATKQILLIQMGTDGAYYGLFQGGNKVTFDIGAVRQYTFSLRGRFTNALEALMNCTDNLKSGGIFTPVTISSTEEGSVKDKVPLAKNMLEEKSAENEKMPEVSDKKSVHGTTTKEEMSLHTIKPRKPNSSLENFLVTAHLPIQPVIKDKKGVSYQWESDGIYGAARPLKWIHGKNLLAMADHYIGQAKSICTGDFARKIGKVKKVGAFDVLESEMICMDGQNDAAAAVLFVVCDGKLNVITQEGTVDQLPAALSKRDDLIAVAARF